MYYGDTPKIRAEWVRTLNPIPTKLPFLIQPFDSIRNITNIKGKIAGRHIVKSICKNIGGGEKVGWYREEGLNGRRGGW